MVEAAGPRAVHVFPYSPRPGTDDRPRRPRFGAGQEESGVRGCAASRKCRAAPLAREARLRAILRAGRPAGRGYGDAVLAPTLLDAPVGENRSRPRAERGRPRKGSLASPREGCLFCRLYREGDHLARADGFVAIADINPQAPVHLLVIPEHHIDSFRDVAELLPAESQRMLEFVAETAREAGLEDYKLQINVGANAGQTVFHLHWHLLGQQATCAAGPRYDRGDRAVNLITQLESDVRAAMRRATRRGAMLCG